MTGVINFEVINAIREFLIKYLNVYYKDFDVASNFTNDELEISLYYHPNRLPLTINLDVNALNSLHPSVLNRYLEINVIKRLKDMNQAILRYDNEEIVTDQNRMLLRCETETILRKKMGKYFSLERFENQTNNLYPKLSNFKRVVSSFNIKRYSISKHEMYKKIKDKERNLKMIRNARLLEQKFVEMSKREIEIPLPTSKYDRFISNGLTRLYCMNFNKGDGND